MPWTAYLVKYNPIVASFSKDNMIFASWAAEQIKLRIQSHAESQKHVSGLGPPNDFLDRFLTAAATHEPPGCEFPMIVNWTMTNLMAGADTTPITIRAVLYLLLKSPSSKTKLLKKLHSAKLSNPVKWNQS